MGAEVRLITCPAEATEIEALVFPGQGTFDQCMGSLAKTGLDQLIKNWIYQENPTLVFVLGCKFYFPPQRKERKVVLVFTRV